MLQGQPEKRAGTVPVLVSLLTAHSRAEEAEVYPAARDEAGAQEEVEHSQQEHAEADQLLQRLAACDPSAAEFDSAGITGTSSMTKDEIAQRLSEQSE